MTFPIQHALLYPARAPGVDAPLDLAKLFKLEFRPVEDSHFPMLRLAKQVMHVGGVAPAIYNAANEIAVAAFLEGRTPFLAIPNIVDHCLQTITNFEPATLADVLSVDAAARRSAQTFLGELKK